ncbi:ABC-2 transporter permease [Ureibacillus acetophenoni]|uniref:ABC-2 family transporter n=1 Tax=Ureibacillus acetophenoni TaxID=614649 RepID=A0A285U1M9_9BACL|nr:ABC-2 transporter permease [Ureibacillus acetophenoni]SOC35643.1 ABC-2 family transporter [Ureibacillus acetophenoni]
MRALLMKDFLMLSKQIKMMVAIFAVLIIISFITNMTMVLVIFSLIFASLQLTTAFTFDEMSKWDKYANTLPVDRKTIVQSKYVLGLILIASGIVIFTPVVFLSDEMTRQLPFIDIFQTIVIVLSIALFYISLTIPLFIKFGTQKARFIIFAIVFLPVFGSGFIQYGLRTVGLNQLMSYIKYVPIAAFVFLLLSYFVSVKWYERKEF